MTDFLNQYSVYIAEAFAFMALMSNIIGYRQSTMQRYRIFSGIAMLLLSTHYFMIDGLAAAIGCGLAVIRNITSLRYNNWWVTGGFVVVNIILMSWQFFYLNDGYSIFLAYAASIIFTIGTLRFNCVNKMRKAFLGAETLSIIYALIIGSIFGSVYSLLNIAIIIWSLYKSSQSETRQNS